MDKELKKQLIKEAQPFIDKINALKKEVEAEEQGGDENNGVSEEVKQWVENTKNPKIVGKSLGVESEGNKIRNINIGQ